MVFEIARFYADSLEHFRTFYNENENLDLVALQQEEQGNLLLYWFDFLKKKSSSSKTLIMD